MPVGGKQWLLNVFDAWIIQEIRSKTILRQKIEQITLFGCLMFVFRIVGKSLHKNT